MKIRDLIADLQQFHPEQVITCYSDDEGLRSSEGPIQIFEVQRVSEVDAEPNRLDGGIGKPALKFGKSERSTKFVLLEITSDV